MNYTFKHSAIMHFYNFPYTVHTSFNREECEYSCYVVESEELTFSVA